VVANHYVSSHPASRFVSHLLLGRTTADRRLGLLDYEFTIRRDGQEPERRQLRDVAELREVMEGEFLLPASAVEALGDRLQGLPRA